MNFLNTFDMIPKNFIVANMVDILKEDPENGVSKIFNTADNFIKDKEVKEIMKVIRHYYDNNPAVKLFIKNMVYNTSKTTLNHTIQNLAVNEIWDGLKKREKSSQQYHVDIPHALVISPNMACGIGCNDCPSSILVPPLMTKQEINKWVSEAKELGVHCIIIDGGDPYLHKELISIYESYSDVQFFVITPGAHLDERICQRLSKVGNVINMFVWDGTESEKGEPGKQIQQTVQTSMNLLKQYGLLFGTITPVRQSNLETVLSDRFIIQMIRNGSRFNAYINSTKEELSEKLSKEQIQIMKKNLENIRVTKPYLTFHMQTDTPFIDRCVTGPYLFDVDVNKYTYSSKIPQITAQNSQGLSLIQILKNLK